MDPFRELRAKVGEIERRLHGLESPVRGSTLVARVVYTPAITGTFTMLGNTEAASPVPPVNATTPSDRRLRFTVIADWRIVRFGEPTATLTITLRQDGTVIAAQEMGEPIDPGPKTLTFDMSDLAPDLHVYQIGWLGSSPLNAREMWIGPNQSTHFYAETRP